MFLRGTQKSGVSYGSHFKQVDNIVEEQHQQHKNQDVKIDFELELEINES